MRNHTTKKRLAFTLVEILIVIAIIGILAALTLQATSTMIDSQRHASTEDQLRILQKALKIQIQYVLEQAEQKETIPARVINMARIPVPGTGLIDPTMDPTPNERKRARVIWKILRQKQEFPMNYVEALHPAFCPFTAPPVTTAFPLDPMPPGMPFPIYDPPPAVPTFADYNKKYPGTKRIHDFVLQSTLKGQTIIRSDLPPKPNYVEYLKGAPGGNQSAVCLLMFLQEKGHGTPFAMDSLSTSQIATNATGLREIVDNWGTPLVFLRYPRGGPLLTGDNPAGAGTKAATLTDPLDPEGLLTDPQWNNVDNFMNWQGVYWFEWYCYRVHVWPNQGNKTTYQRIIPVHSVPLIVSAGKNAKMGLGLITGATNVNPIVITSQNHGLGAAGTTVELIVDGVRGNTNANGVKSATVINADSFQLTGTGGNGVYTGGGFWSVREADDNIYSWRLRMAATAGN